jgi:hypothetical protein
LGHLEVRVTRIAAGTEVRSPTILVALQELPGATVSVIADSATLA